MHANEKALAEAAASLTVQDFRYLEEHRMVCHEEAASPELSSQESASSEKAEGRRQAPRPARRGKRRQVTHEWPEVGTILEADYEGVHYEAEVIAAPELKSGKAVRVLTGPSAGEVCRSLSGAMIEATQKQREEQCLGKKGATNGWAFWRMPEGTLT